MYPTQLPAEPVHFTRGRRPGRLPAALKDATARSLRPQRRCGRATAGPSSVKHIRHTRETLGGTTNSCDVWSMGFEQRGFLVTQLFPKARLTFGNHSGQVIMLMKPIICLPKNGIAGTTLCFTQVPLSPEISL